MDCKNADRIGPRFCFICHHEVTQWYNNCRTAHDYLSQRLMYITSSLLKSLSAPIDQLVPGWEQAADETYRYFQLLNDTLEQQSLPTRIQEQLISLRTLIMDTFVRLITALPPSSESLAERVDWVSQFLMHQATLETLNAELALRWEALQQQCPQLKPLPLSA